MIKKILISSVLTYLALSLFPMIGIGQVIGISSATFYDAEGIKKSTPNAGGLRAPQFNKVDLNFDGVEDLLVFDRAGDVLIPYVYDDLGNRTFDLSVVSGFPPVKEWMIMEDYDQDGIKDIFCFPTKIGLPGIEVWKGKNIDGAYGFDFVEFENESFNILHVPVSSGRTQIFVSVVDIPAIEDIDGDGDLDILSFEPSGSTVFFYRNLAADSSDLSRLDFIVEDRCYGRFFESGFSKDVLLSIDGEGCANSFTEELVSPRHAGSTIEVMDVSGNGLYDMLLGDISFNGINLLNNEGVTTRSWITSSVFQFPQENSVEIELYITAKALDIDNDDIEELLVSPNDFNTSQTTDHIWYYENDKQNALNPELVSKNFLVDDMVHLGESTMPVFTDYNQDGLMDIVIGTGGRYINTADKNPSLFLYKNIGSKDSPEYQLVDSDYLKFNQFRNTSSFFAPSFGDLDGDGDNDLIVGDDRGNLYFADNTAEAGNPYIFANAIYEYSDIRVSSYARPMIIDLNDDGMGDIVLGERNFNSTSEVPIASINYFENIGEIGNPLFNSDINVQPNSAALGAINLKQEGILNNSSAFALHKNKEDYVVLTGSEAGNLRYYSNIKGNHDGTYTEEVNAEITKIDVGMQSSPSLADIDNDGFLELIIGNYRGGITLYDTDLVNDFTSNVSDLGNDLVLSIFPNPVRDIINVKGADTIELVNEILGLDGKVLRKSIGSEIDVSDLRPGIYFLKTITTEGISINKFIKS